MSVEGLSGLQEALDQLPRATQKNILKRVLLKRAKPLVERAKALVPVDSGGLKESIKAVAEASSGGGAGKRAFHEAKKQGKSDKDAGKAARAASRAAASDLSATVVVGPDKRPNAHMVEYGSINNAAKPYMRPAFDASVTEILDGIGKDIGDEIKRAVERRAKRAEKKRTK